MIQHCDGDLDQPGRKQTARPSPIQWQRTQDMLCISAASDGTLVLLGACLYRRVRHPEWTGGQALQMLWPFYLAGALSVCAGWLFRDAKGQ